jgi:hypothetical protein
MFVEEMKSAKEWEDFVEVTPGGTFYHSIEWKKVIEKSFPHITMYLTIRNENGRLMGICPTAILGSNNMRILSSLPYSDFGGPVIDRRCIKDGSLSLQAFMAKLAQEKRISIAKICFPKDGSQDYFKSKGCYVNGNTGVVNLDLKTSPPSFIWEKIFRKKHRKKINRLKKDGFQIREASSRSDLKSFFSLYCQNMKHIGARAHSSVFFDNVWKLLYPTNFNILFAEGRETVGGLASFKYNQTIYLTFLGINRRLISSLEHAYNVAPFLYWGALEWAQENNFRYVCFGSTPAHPKSENERVNLAQKVMFGGALLQQETVFIPFDTYALAFLLFGAKALKVWKVVRTALPQTLRNTMENRFRGMF